MVRWRKATYFALARLENLVLRRTLPNSTEKANSSRPGFSQFSSTTRTIAVAGSEISLKNRRFPFLFPKEVIHVLLL